MIQKDLQGNLWECKVFGTRSSGKTFQAYEQEIERLNNIINKAIEYINTIPLTKGTEWYRIQLLDILTGVDKE